MVSDATDILIFNELRGFEKSFLQSERLTLQLILTELILNTFQYEHNTKYEISMKVCPTTYVCTSQKQHKQKKLVIVTEISFAILKNYKIFYCNQKTECYNLNIKVVKRRSYGSQSRLGTQLAFCYFSVPLHNK